MLKRVLAYLIVTAALLLAVVRITNAYVEYQEHEIRRNAHPVRVVPRPHPDVRGMIYV
jgi:hypothetical protein